MSSSQTLAKVRLHPDSEQTRIVFSSSAEEQFYNQCRATLGAGWQVYHSRTLSTMDGEEGLRDNEIDFVCYHPSCGIIVVEVKGGRIRHDAQTGLFYSINRHGESFAIKDPFQQALVWKSRFLRYLRRHQLRVPVSHAVCFPGAAEEEFPESSAMVPEIVIGRTRMKNLDAALKAIAKKSQPEKYLDFASVGAELDRLLIGSTFTTKLYLRDYIDTHEHRVRDVEHIHETLIMPIASTKRLAIEGEAGTGKTMLAVMLAKHLRDQGKKVLLVGSNALLTLLLRRDLGDGVTTMSYAELGLSYGVNLLVPAGDFVGERDDWIQYEAPVRLKAAIAQSTTRYDVMICDEAQDVQPFWWDALELLLASADALGEEAHFYLFFDSSQGVFGSGGGEHAFVAADTLPIKPPYFPLVHNYRTTREIATFARSFRVQKPTMLSHAGRLGYVPELIVYQDSEDARRLLGRLVRKLTREEGLSNEDLTILSARNPAAKESVLYQTDEVIKIPLHRLTHSQKNTWREAKAPKETIGLTTIAGFKGMETNVGILLNVSEYNLPLSNAIMASLIYVACTRAKHMLYIFVQADDPKRQAFEAAIAAIHTTGAMVLDPGTQGDFEFLGRVTHYNPDRVGWLAVDDPSFKQGSIMFFPSDVQKSDIRHMKVGSLVKFRPHAEGSVTIACDLIPATRGA
ncbi:MAG: NERD domain-containing protein [Proteobacteria bacterium]|nr:NERD domain-containing protein [Pseudomonadota bacterium]